MKPSLSFLKKISQKTAILFGGFLFIFSPYGQGFVDLFTDRYLQTPEAHAALSDPTGLSDLTLWLDGEDIDGDGTAEGLFEAGQAAGQVSTWVDKSGAGNNVTATATPTLTLNELNSKPALIFSNDRLVTAGTGVITANTGYTKVVVFKYDQSSANNLISSSGAAFLGGNNTDLKLYHSSFFTEANGSVDTSRYYIAVGRYGQPDGETNVINVDGTQLVSNNTAQNHNAAAIEIGAFNGGSYLQGRIAEAIVYNRGLDDDEVDCIEGYLSTKWGISVSSTAGACGAGPTITLDQTNYPEYKIFQRDGSDQYDFSLSGTYTETCTAVEASFDGGAYTTIDAAPAGGTWSGTLVDQGVGQGDLTVRCTNDVGASDTASNIGIGDVYVVAGQSNAEGNGENPQSYSTTGPTASVFPTVFSEADAWQVGNDATDTGGTGSSVWPILGGYIVENTDVPVAFITASAGGQRLTETGTFNKDGGNPTSYNNIINQVTQSGVNSVKAVLWFQGESDAGQVTQAVYNEELDELAADLQGDLSGTPDLVAGVIGYWPSEDPTDIQLAIQEAWDDNASILYGPQTYDIDLADGAGDDIHFYEDDEIQTLGYRWWKALEDHYYGGSTGRGPEISSAQLNVTSDEITVVFSANSNLAPLANLSTSVWSVDDNGSSIAVTDASVDNATTVTLTLASEAQSNSVTLSYAENNSGAGENVLTDSATGNTAAGTSPLPADIFVDYTVALSTDPAVFYTGSFTEAVADDGSVTGSIDIELVNDTFVNPIELGSEVSVTNVPTGLTAVITRTDANNLSLTLTGNATSHETANDVSDLTITFLDGAFTTEGTASNVLGYEKTDGVIDFTTDYTSPGKVPGDLTLWLDGSDEDTVFTDDTCTTPAVNGNDVECWQDRSGQANHVTAEAGSTPTFTTNALNGLSILDFMNDSMSTSDADQITVNTSYTKFVVFNEDNDSSISNLISSAGSSHAFFANVVGGGDYVLQLWHGATFVESNQDIGLTDYYIATGRYGFPDGLTNIINVNGTETGSSNVQDDFNPITVTSIGSQGGAGRADAQIAEAIIFDRALTDAEISRVECYLADKWDLTTSNTCNDVASEVRVDGSQTATVSENLALGTSIGDLTSVDPEIGDTHTYSFACTTPGVDDDLFQIDGDTLETNSALDYEVPTDDDTDGTYEICIRTTDQAGNTFDQNISIEVSDDDTEDTDGDGISDGDEDAGPNNGDANGDAVRDAFQVHVLAKENPVTGEYAALVTGGAECTEITTADFLAESGLGGSEDDDFAYPVGLADFELQCDVAGDSADVTIFYQQEYDTSDWVYRKYNGNTDEYADITDITTFGTADVGGETVTTVSFTITDGDADTDEDGLANTVIIDPSGPATSTLVASSSSSRGSSTRKICTDPNAINYSSSARGVNTPSVCEYRDDETTSVSESEEDEFYLLHKRLVELLIIYLNLLLQK